MSNDSDRETRTTVTHDADGVRREEVRETVRRRESVAGWWVAALVALVAAVGLAFVFMTQNQHNELQAAREQGAAEAALEDAAASAQQSATQASQSAQAAMDSTARASQRAAETAQAAANQTVRTAETEAQNVGDASRDASATASSPAPADQ